MVRNQMVALSLIMSASLAIGLSSAVLAQGRMSSREGPPMPAVDANKCVIDGAFTGEPEYGRIRNRAEKEAIETWKKNVGRTYGREFARWKNVSPYGGKDVECSELDRPVGKVWACRAKAVPCMGD